MKCRKLFVGVIMENIKEEINELKEYREKLSKLSEEELKNRDLYLKKLADGIILGPPTNKPSINREWLKYHSDEAIKSDIPKMKIYDYLREKNKDNLNFVAINFFGLKITYKELIEQIERVAKALSAIGVKKGDIVVINSVTLPQTVFLLYALNKIGAIADLTDVRTDSNGMKHYLNEGKAKIVFTLDSCFDEIENILPETEVTKVVLLNPTDVVPSLAKLVNNVSENSKMTKEELKSKKNMSKNIDKKLKTNKNFMDWKSFISLGKNISSVNEIKYEDNFPAAIVHTSGTTSLPKSVVLTNDNFNAMALQYSVSDFNYEKGETLLNIIPIFVAYGVVNSLHMPLCLGMTNILYPKVVNDDFPSIINKFKPNHVIAIPMHWEYLLNDKNFDKQDLSFLKTAACGGDKINIELENKINMYLEKHNSKSKIVKGYGMTEVSACAVTNTNRMSKVGSVGIPLVKNNIAIIDPDTKKELQNNQKGEIYIQTPTLMKEYLNDLAETNETIVMRDGKRWIRTGDLGYIDNDGNLTIDGRIKRLIIRRGFKISAVAIENVIMKNTNVDSCVVVKKNDEEDGEVPYVYLILNERVNSDNMNLQIINEIKQLCSKELPEYYIPNNFKIISQFPYTKNGKLDLLKLEDMANNEQKEMLKSL